VKYRIAAALTLFALAFCLGRVPPGCLEGAAAASPALARLLARR
jgi:hypothetical protein